MTRHNDMHVNEWMTYRGLKKAWGSPNGAMRRGWNGITISRDTIHIEGVKLGAVHHVIRASYSCSSRLITTLHTIPYRSGFEKPVLFEVSSELGMQKGRSTITSLIHPIPCLPV